MVEVIDVIRIVKQDPKAIKLVKEFLAGNISEIKPTTNLATANGFSYPQVESLLETTAQETVTTLEFLANEDILGRNIRGNILFCPHCQSPNLKPGLGCPKCGSGNIGKGRILEHFSCRNNSLEDDYHVDNGKYICPKCKQELRFLGTDYQSLGINYKCRDCGEISKDAASIWQCLQCSQFFPEYTAKEIVLYSYHLNAEKKRKMEFELKERPLFVDLLKKQGYDVVESANVNGTTKSGAKHLIDILAKRDDGLITYTIGVGILISSQGKEVSLAEVFAFDNKVYDLGIHDKVLLVVPKLDQEASRYARQQRIKILEEKDLETILKSPPPSSQKQSSRKPFVFENKAKLLNHLKSSGYKFEEKAKILGRSGVEHTFDILAFNDDGIINHTLGINILVAKDEINFNAVSSFDTRAYDVGIHDKLLLACPKLSHEAKQLAQYQRIKVIEVDDPAKLA
jgi:predicted ATP-grasp superfamily ATP-dependent carboligase